MEFDRREFAALALVRAAGAAEAQAKKPNILVIMDDDIGRRSISAPCDLSPRSPLNWERMN